jgi:hypothetical protein
MTRCPGSAVNITKHIPHAILQLVKLGFTRYTDVSYFLFSIKNGPEDVFLCAL